MTYKNVICFDIDNTITQWDDNRDYANFKPIPGMVESINHLYDNGYYIKLYTSRGMTSCGPGRIAIDIIPGLLQNLANIGLKYHEILTHKPTYEYFVDDKAMSPKEFLKLMDTEYFDKRI